MSEFLKDNLEAERRRSMTEADGNRSLRPHQQRREVPDVLSWIRCFSLYAAVVCSKWPHKSREMFTYQNRIVEEARRGGRGWIMYDTALRQQVTDIEKFDFSQLNQSLYSTTCLQFGNRAKVCPLCNMADHAFDECALHPNRALPMIGVRELISPGTGEDNRKGIDRPRKQLRRGPCFDWNSKKGCSRNQCLFEHRCSKCKGDHKSILCQQREDR